MSELQRSDSAVAGAIINSIFDEVSEDAKQRYLEFFAASIDSLTPQHPDRWGATLSEDGIRLNVGWVECLVLHQDGLNVLVYKKSAPRDTKLRRRGYKRAPGCYMTMVPLSDIKRILPTLSDSHHMAISIAAKRRPPESIRDAHSTGITKFLSHFLQRRVPDPPYTSGAKLHLANGGIGNGDKEFLERAARGGRRARSWVVPKSAAIGDDIVINVAGYGLFATGKIASQTRPRTDWKNRYGADLEAIRLIEPPISLGAVRRHIQDLGWARYPRSIATPSHELAEQIRDLVSKRRKSRMPDLDDAALESANIDELRRVALISSARSVSVRERKILYRARSVAIRRYVLCRANGRCEGCGKPGPFLTPDGSLFLEAHHTTRIADDGPDHPSKVIGLCPNCHRRAHHGKDAKSFNARLIKLLPKLEAPFRKAPLRAG